MIENLMIQKFKNWINISILLEWWERLGRSDLKLGEAWDGIEEIMAQCRINYWIKIVKKDKNNQTKNDI